MRRWAIGILMFGLVALVFIGNGEAGWVYIPDERTTVIEHYSETRWNSASMAVPLGYDYGSCFDDTVLSVYRRPTRHYRSYYRDRTPRRIVKYYYDYPCYEAAGNRMIFDVSDKVLGVAVLWKIYDEVARHNNW